MGNTLAELEKKTFSALVSAFRDWIGSLDGFTPDPKLFLHNLVDAAADNRVIPSFAHLPDFFMNMRPMFCALFEKLQRLPVDPKKFLHSAVEEAAATYVPRPSLLKRDSQKLTIIKNETDKADQ